MQAIPSEKSASRQWVESAPRPFPGLRLERSFTVASLGAFLLVAAALVYVERMEGEFFRGVQRGQGEFFRKVQDSSARQQDEAARRDLFAVHEAGNVNLTRLFANALWNRDFAPFVAKAQQIPVDHCRALAAITDSNGKTGTPSGRQTCLAEVGRRFMALTEFPALDKKVYETMRKSTVLKVKVYDLRGITVYSSDHNQVGEDKFGNQGWKSAAEGRPASQLTHRDKISAFEGVVDNRDLIESYIPVFAPGSEEIVGVFEIYSDVTPFLEQIRKSSANNAALNSANQALVERAAAVNQEKVQSTSNLLFAIIGGLLLLFYLTLYLIVRNAQRIIDRQDLERSHAERELRIAATTFESQDGIMVTDAKSVILRVNGGFTRVTGYSAEEAVGNTPALLKSGRHDSEFYRRMWEALRREGHWRGEIWNRRKDGREYPEWLSISAVAAPDGKVTHYVAAFNDIGARVRAEQALRESDERYRATFEQSSVGIAHVAPDGRWLRVNRKLCDITGYGTEELLARTFQDITHPDDLELDLRLGDRLLAAEIPTYSMQKRYLHKNGGVVWVNLTMALVRKDSGEPDYFISVTEDISARRQAEEALRESEQRFRDLVESTAGIVWEADASTFVFSYVSNNAERLLGYPAADWLQPGFWASHIYAEDRDQAVEFCVACTGRLEDHEFEYRFIARDGQVLWLRDIVKVVVEDGTPRWLRGLMVDVTATKQAEAARASLEAQLRESQKLEAIGTLAGGIAHDFNNIIATILGNAELARQDVMGTNPLALESLDEIRKAGSRARDMVRQILSFGRRQPTERKVAALAPIVEECARLLRAALPARLILEVRCEANVPPVLADATQIQQVVINLATNAMQAMQDGPGRIDIRLDSMILDAELAGAHPALRAMHHQRPGRTVRLSVSDDGPGMDAATLGRIFEPFFTTKPVDEGTGLGLSVVHGIAQAHEGAILVKSRPGEGATFTLYLPEAGTQTKAPAVDKSAPAATEAPGMGGGKHILYVDDDEAVVFLVTRLLQRRGHRISGHRDQLEALDALRANPASFDLVVTDYNMPGMSGLDVAREVRAIRTDLPVAVASGFVDERLRAQARAAGVWELIFKADAVEELCDVVERLANARREKSPESAEQ